MTTLKKYGIKMGITMKDQNAIVEEAILNIKTRYNYTPADIKINFDNLIVETEKEAHKLYKQYEKQYGKALLVSYLKEKIGASGNENNVSEVIGDCFNLLDEFYLSLAQSRKSRAGKSFETIHNSLFKILQYPFTEQAVINGKPDFLMPSVEYYKKNPMDCIIFTAKRTLRERWRQIVTEGTRGLGFFLATIDEKISDNQLEEMLKHRIYVVCPEDIKNRKYADKVNVMSFKKFFLDHLDPKLESWKRNNII